MNGERSRSLWIFLAALLLAICGAAEMAQESSGEQREYVGEPVSMSLRDARLAEVLDALSTVARIDLEFTDAARELLEGPVTVRLDRVPWDQALEEILRVNRLVLERADDGTLLVRRQGSDEPGTVGLPLADSPQTEPLDLDLAGTELHGVLHGFAALVGADLEADPALEGLVSLKLNRVDWTTALNAVCESAGCRWRLIEDRRRVLVVEAGNGVDPADRVSVALNEALSKEAVLTLLRMARQQFLIHGSLDATLSIKLKGVAWHTALDAICQAVGCAWEMLEDPLRVEVIADAHPPRSTVLPLAPLEERVGFELEGATGANVLRALARVLGATLVTEGTEIEGDVSLDWKDRTARSALDELCDRLGLEWRYEVEPSSRRLIISPR